MNSSHVSSVEQDCIFRTLSAILSLGNAEFIDVTDENGSECAVIAENYLIARVAELLGFPPHLLLLFFLCPSL
jgi:myosin heavy subunit